MTVCPGEQLLILSAGYPVKSGPITTYTNPWFMNGLGWAKGTTETIQGYVAK